MRILVTGGCGYIGSHVVQALLETGHQPVVYDNLSTGHAQAVTTAELIVGEVGDQERLERLLRDRPYDGCIHLAASSQVGESTRHPSQYFSNNVAAGLSLFDALVAGNVPWIVLSSTAAVYGEPETIPIPEEHRTVPSNPYGESKRILEQVLHWYDKAYGLRYTALRYFNAGGAHPNGHIGEDHTPETHLIPLVLEVALGQRESISVFGTNYPTLDGTAVRDYVHVCDLASAHIAAMTQLERGGASGAYNLGSQTGYSVLQIIEMAREATARDIRVELADRRPGDPAVLIASSDRARRELGWSPRPDLRSIMESAWKWHATNPRGYRG